MSERNFEYIIEFSGMTILNSSNIEKKKLRKRNVGRVLQVKPIQIKPCESCQNESSALTTNVNGVDFALGHGGDLHSSTAHTNHNSD